MNHTVSKGYHCNNRTAANEGSMMDFSWTWYENKKKIKDDTKRFSRNAFCKFSFEVFCNKRATNWHEHKPYFKTVGGFRAMLTVVDTFARNCRLEGSNIERHTIIQVLACWSPGIVAFIGKILSSTYQNVPTLSSKTPRLIGKIRLMTLILRSPNGSHINPSVDKMVVPTRNPVKKSARLIITVPNM